MKREEERDTGGSLIREGLTSNRSVFGRGDSRLHQLQRYLTLTNESKESSVSSTQTHPVRMRTLERPRSLLALTPSGPRRNKQNILLHFQAHPIVDLQVRSRLRGQLSKKRRGRSVLQDAPRSR
jgi:hypothetical protein